jgi:hypothetical protein
MTESDTSQKSSCIDRSKSCKYHHNDNDAYEKNTKDAELVEHRNISEFFQEIHSPDRKYTQYESSEKTKSLPVISKNKRRPIPPNIDRKENNDSSKKYVKKCAHDYCLSRLRLISYPPKFHDLFDAARLKRTDTAMILSPMKMKMAPMMYARNSG